MPLSGTWAEGLISKLFRDIARGIASGLFPDICMSCNEWIEPDRCGVDEPAPTGRFSLEGETPERLFKAVMGRHLCRMCLDAYAPVSPPFCTRCGVQFRSRSVEGHLCGRCITKPVHQGVSGETFISARACGQYSGTLKNTVHAYKYLGKYGLGRPLGTLLHAYYVKHFAEKGIDWVVPVPLHRKKLVARGFDQVTGMLRHWPWTSANGSRFLDNGTALAENLLQRVKHTDTQTGLDRKQRGANVKNAFAVTGAVPVKRKRVLIVDDVYTTGATLEECARALQRAGASEIYVLTLARAM